MHRCLNLIKLLQEEGLFAGLPVFNMQSVSMQSVNAQMFTPN